jgi:hypothetical protein
LDNTSCDQGYYRVFAYGPGHGALISERFSKPEADKRRHEWQESMPQAVVRIEKVNAEGRAVCDMILSI